MFQRILWPLLALLFFAQATSAEKERVRPPSSLCSVLSERFDVLRSKLVALGLPLTDLPGLVEYVELKIELLFFLNRIRTNLQTIETDEKFKKFLDQLQNEVVNNVLPLTTIFVTSAPEIAVLTQNRPTPSPHTGLAFGPLHGYTSSLSPVYFEGILLKELRHLYDIRRLGWASPLIRISRSNDHEATLLQAQYWQQTGPQLNNPTIRAALIALPEAPDGILWNTYLKKSEVADYDLLEGLQRYIDTQFEHDLRTNPSIVYNSILTPLGHVLLNKFYTLPDNRSVRPEEIQTIKETLKSILTYIAASRKISNTVFDRVKRPSEKAIRAQAMWFTTYLDLEAHVHLYERFLGTAGMKIILEGNMKIEAEYQNWENQQATLKQEAACASR